MVEGKPVDDDPADTDDPSNTDDPSADDPEDPDDDAGDDSIPGFGVAVALAALLSLRR